MQQTGAYGGVIVPVVTPVTADGQLDTAAAGRIVEHVVSAGASVFVLGTTGEAPSIPKDWRVRLVEAAVKANAGRKAVYAGISSNCLADSLELAGLFADLGADAVFAHVPGFYPLSDDDVLRYYQELADSSPLPLLVYNIPSMTNTCLSLDVVQRLSHHHRIIGLKDSHNDIGRLRQVLAWCKDRQDFFHLTGCSGLSKAGLELGSRGIVPSAGNLFPGLFCRLYQAVMDGQIELSARLQGLADRIAAVYDRGRYLGHSIAILKAMMHLKGLCSPHMLAPLGTLAADQIERLGPELAQIEEALGRW